MHLTRKMIAFRERDFQAARRALLNMNGMNGTVNRMAITMFHRFSDAEAEFVCGSGSMPTRIYEE